MIPRSLNGCVPARPHAPWDALAWEDEPAHRHSIKGQIGVDYILFAHTSVVVKRGPEVGREWLAMDVGCRVPTPMTLGPSPHPAMCTLLSLPPEMPVLMMSFVPGRTFFELSEADKISFCQPDAPRGRRLIGQMGLALAFDLFSGKSIGIAAEQVKGQMGLALAFDLFSGNTDRFPAVGPLGANSGNLMICGDDVFCIDNAIWHYGADESRREAKHGLWREKVSNALTIARGLDDPEAKRSRKFLEKSSSFVTARLRDAPLPDEAFQARWAEAFCDGILAVSALTHERLDAQVARLQPPPAGLMADIALLHQNLVLFHQAATSLRTRMRQEDSAAVAPLP